LKGPPPSPVVSGFAELAAEEKNMLHTLLQTMTRYL
jgi:hypothetical protein